MHLQGRRGGQPLADTRLPGQPRHGVPQGLGGARRRSTRPTARPRRCCATRDGELEPVDWPTRARRVRARAFKAIQAEHGPESVAFLSTGQIPTEEMALLGALAKFGMGMVHGDGNTRQCMATSVVAYKQAFGFDAPPYTYADFEESDVLVFVGANPCIAHPIMWERVLRNPQQPEIIVIDPRRTETAMAATQHLPLAPKTDLVAALRPGARARARGLDRPRVHRRAHRRASTSSPRTSHAFTPERVGARAGHRRRASSSGSPRTIHERQARVVLVDDGRQPEPRGRAHRAGDHQPRADDRQHRPPGTGANSITGQCNAMGSRLFSNTTNLLGGHDFANAEHRAKVAGVLGIDVGAHPRPRQLGLRPDHRGHPARQDQGPVGRRHQPRALVDQPARRCATCSAGSTSSSCRTCTTRPRRRSCADLVLPAAGWGEKEGTFINSERRIGLIKKVARAPGPGAGRLLTSSSSSPTPGAAARCSSAGARPRRCSRSSSDSRAASRATSPASTTTRMLDELGGVQWPLPEGAERRPRSRAPPVRGRPVLHPDGRARLHLRRPAADARAADDELSAPAAHRPRQLGQWHTQTRTGKSAVLRKLYPEHAYVEINPADAARLGIRPERLGAWSTSQRGQIEAARVRDATSCRPASVFVPMHDATTNRLTFPAFDPVLAPARVQGLRVASAHRRCRPDRVTTLDPFANRNATENGPDSFACTSNDWPGHPDRAARRSARRRCARST